MLMQLCYNFYIIGFKLPFYGLSLAIDEETYSQTCVSGHLY